MADFAEENNIVISVIVCFAVLVTIVIVIAICLVRGKRKKVPDVSSRKQVKTYLISNNFQKDRDVKRISYQLVKTNETVNPRQAPVIWKETKPPIATTMPPATVIWKETKQLTSQIPSINGNAKLIPYQSRASEPPINRNGNLLSHSKTSEHEHIGYQQHASKYTDLQTLHHSTVKTPVDQRQTQRYINGTVYSPYQMDMIPYTHQSDNLQGIEELEVIPFYYDHYRESSYFPWFHDSVMYSSMSSSSSSLSTYSSVSSRGRHKKTATDKTKKNERKEKQSIPTKPVTQNIASRQTDKNKTELLEQNKKNESTGKTNKERQSLPVTADKGMKSNEQLFSIEKGIQTLEEDIGWSVPKEKAIQTLETDIVTPLGIVNTGQSMEDKRLCSVTVDRSIQTAEDKTMTKERQLSIEEYSMPPHVYTKNRSFDDKEDLRIPLQKNEQSNQNEYSKYSGSYTSKFVMEEPNTFIHKNQDTPNYVLDDDRRYSVPLKGRRMPVGYILTADNYRDYFGQFTNNETSLSGIKRKQEEATTDARMEFAGYQYFGQYRGTSSEKRPASVYNNNQSDQLREDLSNQNQVVSNTGKMTRHSWHLSQMHEDNPHNIGTKYQRKHRNKRRGSNDSSVILEIPKNVLQYERYKIPIKNSNDIYQGKGQGNEKENTRISNSDFAYVNPRITQRYIYDGRLVNTQSNAETRTEHFKHSEILQSDINRKEISERKSGIISHLGSYRPEADTIKHQNGRLRPQLIEIQTASTQLPVNW